MLAPGAVPAFQPRNGMVYNVAGRAAAGAVGGAQPHNLNIPLSWGSVGQGSAKTGATGAQSGTGGAGYQQPLYNQQTYGNGYTPINNAMNYGSYAGGGMAMGAPVQGIPIWGSNGQPMQGGGGSWQPKTYQQAYGNPGGSAPRPTMAQQFLNDVQAQANAAKQANETRYDQILNGDDAGVQGAMLNWLKQRNPKATSDWLNKAMANPQMQAMFNQQNPNVAASFGGYRDRFQRGMSYLDGAGAQAEKDIRTDYDRSNNRSQMDLMKRGLGNSTITANQTAATERRKQDAIGRLKESLRNQYLDTDARLSGDTLQFMERRNDTYPDQMAIANLMMQFGNAGMLGYTGGGGGGGGWPTLTYTGQQTTSSYGVNNSRGFNQPSAYGTTKWY